MKNLIINLSLISTFLIGQSALAQDEVTSLIEKRTIETIVVTAKPNVANFEIFSTKITEQAIDSAMELMLKGLSSSITNDGPSLASVAVDAGRSI